MKTKNDTPEREPSDAMRFTGAKTKKEAVVTASADYNRRHKMAELVKYSGTFTSLLSNDEIEQLETAKGKRRSK